MSNKSILILETRITVNYPQIMPRIKFMSKFMEIIYDNSCLHQN
jgi:hypothetical protein